MPLFVTGHETSLLEVRFSRFKLDDASSKNLKMVTKLSFSNTTQSKFRIFDISASLSPVRKNHCVLTRVRSCPFFIPTE